MLIGDISIQQLVNMVNELLAQSQHTTVASASDKLGFKPSSVKMKLKRGGYYYDRERRQYIKGTNKQLDTCEIKRDANVATLKCKEPVFSTPKVKPLTDSEIAAIRTILAQYKHNTDTIHDTNNIQLAYKYSNDDTITRNIKLSRELNTKLVQLMHSLPKGTRVLDVYNTIFSYYLKEHGLL